MGREYHKDDSVGKLNTYRHNIIAVAMGFSIASVFLTSVMVSQDMGPYFLFFFAGLCPAAALYLSLHTWAHHRWIETEREKESARRKGAPVLGLPPRRNAFQEALADARKRGKVMIDKYLVGFELENGEPIWVDDDDLCSHACVFAKTGVGKTLWLEGLMFQQLARGRASGFTFIDAKRDPGTLADIIMMALITGRIEDIIVVDPFDPVCTYNFVFTPQRADVKARKVLRCGLPPTSDASTTKHYDRLAADAVYRVVRAMESLGLAWSVRDIAVALSAFQIAYPRLRQLLHDRGAKQAMVELGHLAGTYRNDKGRLDTSKLTDNLRGISSELHSISNSEAGEMFCAPRADLSLTDAILRGKIVYYMLPRLEEAESAARMVKVFREDLEVSIGEITSSRVHHLEDPHMVIIDEGASTFGPTWANLFELARKGRFALLFGAQSIGGLMDETMGLSEQFYERVIANVNLKVIMRIGDNKTAMDMSEWIGKINIEKQSYAIADSSSYSSREFIKNVELNRRSADGEREGVNISDDEEDLVSPEELKHEMSAEKGLAWFDKGDGTLRKGRALWFNAELPVTWEGREYLTNYESIEADEIGLAEWVDEFILSTERADIRKEEYSGNPPPPGGPQGAPGQSKQPNNNAPMTPNNGGGPAAKAEEPEPGGPFRFNLMRNFKGKPRSRTFVADTPPGEEAVEPAKKEVEEKQKAPQEERKPEPVATAEEESIHPPERKTNGSDAPPPRKPAPKPRPGLRFADDKEKEKEAATPTESNGQKQAAPQKKGPHTSGNKKGFTLGPKRKGPKRPNAGKPGNHS